MNSTKEDTTVDQQPDGIVTGPHPEGPVFPPSPAPATAVQNLTAGSTMSAVALPDSDLARAVVVEVGEAETPPILHHSIRSFLFARLLADHLGARADAAYDEDLLFAACTLHDIGLAASTGGSHRFEIEGADRAATFLTSFGLPADRVDTVWQAIAFHTSFQIAERRGLIPRLVRGGVGIDFGYDADMITDAQADAIHTTYPRLDLERNLVDLVVDQATSEPQRAPRYSMTAVLLSQRATAPHLTQIETAAASSRWADVP